MPGHVKLGGKQGEDPDPEPYLVVSMEMKREDMMRRREEEGERRTQVKKVLYYPR